MNSKILLIKATFKFSLKASASLCCKAGNSNLYSQQLITYDETYETGYETR